MINVIEIHEGVVYQNLLFTGRLAKERAEETFRNIVREHEHVTNEELDQYLDDGYFTADASDWTVCISHPEVKS